MKITDGQKAKMTRLGIAWIETMTAAEAREAIIDFEDKRFEKDQERKSASDLNQDALVIGGDLK